MQAYKSSFTNLIRHLVVALMLQQSKQYLGMVEFALCQLLENRAGATPHSAHYVFGGTDHCQLE